MTIYELLESLDGFGLVLTDDDLLADRLSDLHLSFDIEVPHHA